MDYHWIAYLFAIAAGLVSSGAIGSLWAASVGEVPDLESLEYYDWLTPLRGLAFVLSAPTHLLLKSLDFLYDETLVGLSLLFIGITLSFLQGVVILTQVFGVT